MKALTVFQPWASLIAKGWKKYEFRIWEAKPASLYGQRIAIHAAARPVKAGEVHDILKRVHEEHSLLDPACAPFLQETMLRAYPRSCFVGIATLGTPLPPEALAAMCNDSDRAEHYRWAWPLENATEVPHVPCRGYQRFWTVPAWAEQAMGLEKDA